jgi:hypothetical protein
MTKVIEEERAKYSINSSLTKVLQETVEEEVQNIRKSNEVMLGIFSLFFGFLIATININNFSGAIILFFMMTTIGFSVSIMLEVLITNLLRKSIKELYRIWSIGRVFYLLDEMNVVFVIASGMLWLFNLNFQDYNSTLFGAIVLVEVVFFSIRYSTTQKENPFNKKNNLLFRWLLNEIYNEIIEMPLNESYLDNRRMVLLIESKIGNLSNLNRNFVFKNILKILCKINFLEKIVDPVAQKELYYLKLKPK